MKYEIINMDKKHWEQVKEIYCEGIDTGIATFQTEAPSYEQWNNLHLEIGIREKIARPKNRKWSDTVLMEFRSKTVGID